MHTSKLSIYPPIIAHRGAAAMAPENTLSAFKKVSELGLAWVEFDVMFAKCGEVVVFHDVDLQRTTNAAGQVIDFPYEILKTFDAGSWFAPHFAHEVIPTLHAVLDCLSQLKLSANIEIKALPGQENELVRSVADIVKHYSIPVLISSFSREALLAIKQYLPNHPCGFLMHEWQNDWSLFCNDIQVDTVNVNHDILSPTKIHEIKLSKRLLLAYTVNTLTLAKQLFSSGVDAIFSDCPQEIVTKGTLYGHDHITHDMR